MAADFTLDSDDDYGSQFVDDDDQVCFYSEIQTKHGQVRLTQCKYIESTLQPFFFPKQTPLITNALETHFIQDVLENKQKLEKCKTFI